MRDRIVRLACGEYSTLYSWTNLVFAPPQHDLAPAVVGLGVGAVFEGVEGGGALPCGVFGPVQFWALAWLAATCRSETWRCTRGIGPYLPPPAGVVHGLPVCCAFVIRLVAVQQEYNT